MNGIKRTRLGLLTLLGALPLALASCRSTPIVLTSYGQTPRVGAVPVFDVALIPIIYVPEKASGQGIFVTPFPKQQLKAKQEIAIWAVVNADGAKLDIKFTTDPFDYNIRCPGNRFCFALSPSSKPAGHYPYVAKITYKNQDYTLDPEVEIWE